MIIPLCDTYEKISKIYRELCSDYTGCPQHHEKQCITEFLREVEVELEKLRNRLRSDT